MLECSRFQQITSPYSDVLIAAELQKNPSPDYT